MPQPYLAHAPYSRLIQQLEQAQLKLDEADELLAQLLAKFNAAESRFVRIRVARWRIETELAQLCRECTTENSNPLEEAWKKKYAVEAQLEQESHYIDALQIQLEKIKSVRNSLASQLTEIKHSIECERNVLQAHIEQEQLHNQQQAVELKQEERDDAPVDDMPAQRNRIEIQVDQFDTQIEQLSELLTLLLIGQNASASLPATPARIHMNEIGINSSIHLSTTALAGDDKAQAQGEPS